MDTNLAKFAINLLEACQKQLVPVLCLFALSRFVSRRERTWPHSVEHGGASGRRSPALALFGRDKYKYRSLTLDACKFVAKGVVIL